MTENSRAFRWIHFTSSLFFFLKGFKADASRTAAEPQEQQAHVRVFVSELKPLAPVSYSSTEWLLQQKQAQPESNPPNTHTHTLTVHTGGSGSCSSGDLALLTGAAGRLPGDGPSWLAAVPVQRHNLTCPRCQLAWKRHYTTGQRVRERGSHKPGAESTRQFAPFKQDSDSEASVCSKLNVCSSTGVFTKQQLSLVLHRTVSSRGFSGLFLNVQTLMFPLSYVLIKGLMYTIIKIQATHRSSEKEQQTCELKFALHSPRRWRRINSVQVPKIL